MTLASARSVPHDRPSVPICVSSLAVIPAGQMGHDSNAVTFTVGAVVGVGAVVVGVVVVGEVDGDNVGQHTPSIVCN